MKILAIEKENPGIHQDEIAPFLKAEARKVWELRHRKIITEIYFAREGRLAVLVMECPDKETAQRYLCELPLVANRLIGFELLTLEAYSGFARLFDENLVLSCLRSSWSSVTSAKWSPEKPECGQCSVTALVLHDLFGGEILKTRIGSFWHFYNRISGNICDFTKLQFDYEITYENINASWEEAMDDTSPYQFQALKSKFQEQYFSV